LYRAHQWWIKTKRSDLNWKKEQHLILQLGLCEDHFEASQFMNPAEKGTPKPRKHLRKDALPTLFKYPSAITPNSSSKERRILHRIGEK